MVEQIVAKPVPLSSKVKLDAANATIAKLRKTLQEVTTELAAYKSVKGQLRIGALEQENGELKRQNAHYQDILRQHGFSYLLGGRAEKIQRQEMR